MSRISHIFAAAVLAGSLTFTASEANANENVMVVFDGSNSMWGQIEGTAKIEIARGAMANLLGEWTADRQVGLMAYGHRRRGDCSDIETLVAPGEGTRDEILSRINAITPTGKTPLTDAVEQAATALSYADQPATVILISDGLESCERDPCALAAALETGGVGFTAHVVGFGLAGDADAASLSCIAEETGGQYLSASNADELGQALSAVSTAVAQAPEPEPVVEPEPEPEPELPEVVLSIPKLAVTGSLFPVTWAPILSEDDYISIVPVGAKEGTYRNYIVSRQASDGELRAPADSGMYEVRYVDRASSKTLGMAPIEIAEPSVTITAPAAALTGQAFGVSWTGAIDKGDYITIVPMGANEGKYGNYFTVRNNTEGDLKAPAETGMYEVRYVLREGAKTLASQPIEITEAEVTVSGPTTAVTGEAFEVSWTGAVDKGDYITIVAMGADEGTYGDYFTVRDNTEGELKAPAETGIYEVRYVLREGAKTLARHTIEIGEPEITISAPQTALAGQDIRVSWTGAVNARDYINIVPMGADEGTFGKYFSVRDKTEKDLQVQGDPGLYELRYVLNEGSKTMVRQTIELTEAEVTLTTPEQIRLGDKLKVSWTGTVNKRDYINLVPMGTPDDTFDNYFSVRDRTEQDMRTPEATGMYELRYMLNVNSRVLARRMVEVLPADAALETGASLSAPQTAAPGSMVEVSWSVESESADQRITLARADQAIFTWVAAVKITGAPPVQITMPDAPGLYELRFLDVSNQAVLARQVIKVE